MNYYDIAGDPESVGPAAAFAGAAGIKTARQLFAGSHAIVGVVVVVTVVCLLLMAEDVHLLVGYAMALNMQILENIAEHST